MFDLQVAKYVEALQHEDYVVQEIAAAALVKIGTIEALKDEEWEQGRESAAEALGKIGDARAVPPLSAALDDEDRGVRESAAAALGKISDASDGPAS